MLSFTQMDPVILLIILALLVIGGFGALFLYFSRIFEEIRAAQKQDQYLEFFKEMRGSMDENLKTMHERLDRAAKVLADFSEKAGGMEEIGRQIRDFQQLLRSPKLRGLVGEQQLEAMLSSAFPPQFYALQYEIKGVGKVDAVIKHPQGLIPVDAKFSLENFSKMVSAQTEEERGSYQREFVRDGEGRIKETAKYIRPEEGTLDFAVMFVPSDSVYYEIINNEALLKAAEEKRVLITSPHVFWHFLRAIQVSLRGARASEEARRVLALVDTLGGETEKFGESLSTLEGHLNNAKNKMDEVKNGFAGILGRVSQLKFLGEGQEKPKLEKG